MKRILICLVLLFVLVAAAPPPAKAQSFGTRWYLEMIVRYEGVKDPATGVKVFTDTHIRIESLQSPVGEWTMKVWWRGELVYSADYVAHRVYVDKPGGWRGYIHQEVKRIIRELD